jgi:ATP-binding cassette subfamily F protein uup
MPPLLYLKDTHLTFGGTPLLEGAGLSLEPRGRVCLVGRNGSGKSTLLKIAAGETEPDSGERFVQPGTTIRYLAQEPDFSSFATVHDFVSSSLGPGDDVHRADRLISDLGLSGDSPTKTLSGGERRRCALAQTLAPNPDILLLDEPTNHLDLPMINWLEMQLSQSKSAIIIVSHDRRLLETLSEETVWLFQGQSQQLDRGFRDFERWRDEFVENQARERKRLDKKLEAETQWLHKGVTARRKRNQGRLRALNTLRAEQKSWKKAVDGAMKIAEGQKSSKLVFEAKRISKSFGARQILKDFDLRAFRGDRIGVVGPNGVGKTTLIKILMGELEPDKGSVRLGANLEIATLDQQRDQLDNDTSVTEALTRGKGDAVMVGEVSRHVIGYMKDFMFAAEQKNTPVSALSGGERGRLMLARAFAQPSNLLVLDEPTNDLDLETLDLLQEMLGDYNGTVLLVSHDRDFLDRVVTSIIAPDGKGDWREYMGGYKDLAEQHPHLFLGFAIGAPSKKEPTSARNPRERLVQKAKLSFHQKHALETLPVKIDALGGTIENLTQQLSEPNFYSRDAKTFQKLTHDLEDAQRTLAQAEEQWLELEMLRESLEN